MSALNLHDEMRKSGIECEDRVVVDGEIHRFNIPGQKRGKRNGWYVFHQKGEDVFGAFGDWKSGFSSTIGAKTPEIRQELRKVDDRREKKALSAAARSQKQWDAAKPLIYISKSKYLCRKHAKPFGLRFDDGKVLVPMYRDGEIVGVQTIDIDGVKRFTAGMAKRGSWHEIAGIGDTVVLCEGYATGASIRMATRLPVLVAFDCGNLLPAAQNFAAYCSGRKIKWIVAADNDQKTVGNPGLTKACEAYVELDGRLAIPFGTSGTDFNDMHIEHGIDAVTIAIYGCL